MRQWKVRDWLRHPYFISSAFVTGILFFFSLYFMWNGTGQSEVLLVVTFTISQILILALSALTVVFKFTGVVKKGIPWIYFFCASFQIWLAVTDILLLSINHSMTRISLLTFLALNLLFGEVMLNDILKKSS